jgi:acetoacetyl-CoA synthetase
MWSFLQKANKKYNLDIKNFSELYQWSVGDNRTDFWDLFWDEVEIIHSGTYKQVVDVNARMDSIPHWFKGVKMNFAENLMFTRGSRTDETSKTNKEDDRVVVTEVREGATEIKQYNWGQIRHRVGILSNAMRAHGVKKGDRVAVVASNSLDTLCVFLAVTALGGMFSSSSTDMGTKGILDRLLQISPVFVFIDDWAVYNGNTMDLRPKINELVAGLKDDKIFKGVVTQRRFAQFADLSAVPRATTWDQFTAAAGGNAKLTFEPLEYRDPFLVVYSSGTTGIPKCIVHSVGGVLTSTMKEGKIHRDIGVDTVGLQYTTVSSS